MEIFAMLEFENTSNFNFLVSIGSHGKHEFDQFMQFCQDNKSLDVSLYSSKEVQKKADISKIQLIHWSQSGVIIPADDARGRGSRRKYSFQNLVAKQNYLQGTKLLPSRIELHQGAFRKPKS